MIVVTANTSEEFMVEQLQQAHGMNSVEAAQAIERFKELGLYDDLLIKAGEALKELFQNCTQAPTDCG